MRTENVNYHQASSSRSCVTAAGGLLLFAGGLFLYAFLAESELLILRVSAGLVASFFLVLAVISAVMSVVAAVRPRWFETRIATSADGMEIKLPGRRMRTIEWDAISRIEGIQTGDGPFGDDVSVRIRWNDDKLTLSDDLVVSSGLLSLLQMRYGHGFNAAWHVALQSPAGSKCTLWAR